MAFKQVFSRTSNNWDLSAPYLDSLSADEGVRAILHLLDSGIFDVEHLLTIKAHLDELMLEEGLSDSPTEPRNDTRFRIEYKRIEGKIYIYLRSARRELPDKYIGRLPLEIGKVYRMEPQISQTSRGEKIIKALEARIENETDIYLKIKVDDDVNYYRFPDCFKTTFSKKEWQFTEIKPADVEKTKEVNPASSLLGKKTSVETIGFTAKTLSQNRERTSSIAPIEALTKQSESVPSKFTQYSIKEQRQNPLTSLARHSEPEKDIVQKPPKKIDLTQQPKPKVVLNIAPEQSEQFIKSLKQWVMFTEFPVTTKRWELNINNDLVSLLDKVENRTILIYRKDSCQIKSFYSSRAILELMSEISFAVANSPSVGHLNCSVARRFFVHLEAGSKMGPETTLLAYLFNVTEQK